MIVTIDGNDNSVAECYAIARHPLSEKPPTAEATRAMTAMKTQTHAVAEVIAAEDRSGSRSNGKYERSGNIEDNSSGSNNWRSNSSGNNCGRWTQCAYINCEAAGDGNE